MLEEVQMSGREKFLRMQGFVAGTVMGLAIGLITALTIAIRPDLFS